MLCGIIILLLCVWVVCGVYLFFIYCENIVILKFWNYLYMVFFLNVVLLIDVLINFVCGCVNIEFVICKL